MYKAKDSLYNSMRYNYTGNSGLQLPKISLGLWHNFGGIDSFDQSRKMILYAFDNGITHIDLANNYGPPPGSAEETFGKILKEDLNGYRDELIISTKAGYEMWDGPYGRGGSRKYLVASLDQSLSRMGLDYVDIYYHHCPDPNTSLEESMGALDSIVKSGKALYVGVSSYSPDLTARAHAILKGLGTPLTIHQPIYNMLNRKVEDGLLDALSELQIGCIPFSPLAQGLLTDKYFNGIPQYSRANKDNPFLNPEDITLELLTQMRKLDEVASSRDQKLSQLAISWLLRRKEVTSVLIGASSLTHIDDAVQVIDVSPLSDEELSHIDRILSENHS